MDFELAFSPLKPLLVRTLTQLTTFFALILKLMHKIYVENCDIHCKTGMLFLTYRDTTEPAIQIKERLIFFSLEIKIIILAYKYNVSLNTFCSLIKHNKEINLEMRTPLFLNQYVGLIKYLSAID